MAQMVTKNFKPKSTTKIAKKIIRKEIKDYYGCDSDNRPYGKDFLSNMQKDANSYSAGINISDYNKGRELANIGNFAFYYDDQCKMLIKIYGKKKVEGWSVDKVRSIYCNLIGREYASLLRERDRKCNSKNCNNIKMKKY